MLKKLFLLLISLPLCACQTGALNNANVVDPETIAAAKTCEQINHDLARLDKVINASTPSQTEELMKKTATSAARTGVVQSGVLGSAGAFAGLGLNFLTGLYSINSGERAQQALENAYYQQDVLLAAANLKGCSE